jgi:uncharacterized membrane protein
MNEQRVHNPTLVPWPLRQLGRVFLSAAAGCTVGLAASALPQETRIILGLDAFLATLVALTCVMVSAGTADKCALIANRPARIQHTAVIASIAATLLGIAAIAVMLHSQKNEARWLRILHPAGSLLALSLGWIAAQMTFAIQYMRLYYRQWKGSPGQQDDAGLVFPSQPRPNLWDFVYYSFTIAMCFQTSDVSITGTAIRRLTLLHAIYSFFFVAAIFGFAVNILSNIA